MSRIVKIKNNTSTDQTWTGVTIVAGEYYNIPAGDMAEWVGTDDVFKDIGNSNLVVNNGTDDIVDSVTAWNWMLGDTMPMSELGNKLAIHSSTKPAKENQSFYLVWTGAGDDVSGSPPVIGDGDLIQFSLTQGMPSQSVEARFAPEFGDVYIHEGYAKWEQGGTGDYIDAVIVATASQFQTAINLDLEIVDNWVKYATGGAGTGTHGFASTPVLMPRTKSTDGDWDYDTVNGLVPNMSGTGGYRISDIERVVHHYINKIPTRGSSYGYTVMTSDESAQLPVGYFIRVTAHNASDSEWMACVFMEVFREQTANP